MKKLSKNSFKALFVKKKNNKFKISFESTKIQKISSNELLIKVNYSTINHKDVLVCKGNPGLVRKFPHIPGIDASGVVIESKTKKFKKGDKVIIAAKPFGIKEFGAFAEFIKVNHNYVEKLPQGLSLKDAMIFGTAGFTSMLAIHELLNENLRTGKKNILVSGATGGVGSISILILSSLGFRVSALTSKKGVDNFLKKIGASEIISLKNFNKLPKLHLLKEKYSGIIDNLGGEIISSGSRQLIKNGVICSIGAVSSQFSDLNIMPLILRGVKIIGINAEDTKNIKRKKIWEKISQFTKKKKINRIYKLIKFKNLISSINKINMNKNIGRIVIKM